MIDAHLTYTRNQNLNIVRIINDYWRSPVARVTNDNLITSTLVYGVPPHARHITHPAIVWMNRSEGPSWIVRR
jgi:hypothetical protein